MIFPWQKFDHWLLSNRLKSLISFLNYEVFPSTQSTINPKINSKADHSNNSLSQDQRVVDFRHNKDAPQTIPEQTRPEQSPHFCTIRFTKTHGKQSTDKHCAVEEKYPRLAWVVLNYVKLILCDSSRQHLVPVLFLFHLLLEDLLVCVVGIVQLCLFELLWKR